MKYTITLIIISLIIACSKQQKEEPFIYTTEYFEIHNNYWINLHHFLYQKAKGSQLKKLQEDGKSFLSIGEEAVIENLNSEEAKELENAVMYYKENLIHQNLRRDLGDLRVWLQQQEPSKEIVDTTFSKKYTTILNSFSKVYEDKFWPLYSSHNEKIIGRHLDLIREYEVAVIGEMESLAEYKLPIESKIRVDISTYANWAGAYTPTKPKLNIIISTIDQTNVTTGFIETVYHEGSHLIFSRESPFRSRIYHKSKEMKMEFPGGLWHASLFYLCGRVTQDHLKEKGINHKLIMKELNIFQEYNTKEFRGILEKYYEREYNLETTIENLLEELNK